MIGGGVAFTDCGLKGGVHISAHVHESKCFFLFLINFMALKKIPCTCTSVIIKMLVDCTHIVDIEFSVDS